MLVHQHPGIFATRTLANRDQFGTRRHDVLDGLIELLLEAQIAVGDDADDFAIGLHHRQPGNTVLLCQRQHVPHGHVLGNCDRILDDAALEPLDLGDLGGLRLRRHVLVHDADSTFLGNGDRQTGFGHSVHRCSQQRNVKGNATCQLGFEADFARQDGGMCRNQQHIIESQGFLHHAHEMRPSQREDYRLWGVNGKPRAALFH